MIEFLVSRKEKRKDIEKQKLYGSPKEPRNIRGSQGGICMQEALAVCF